MQAERTPSEQNGRGDHGRAHAPCLPVPAPAPRRWQRWLLIAAGILSLVLAAIGAVLPGLPTTPFVLLAAACFAKSSPRLHAWLLAHRWLGPLVRDWERHRSLPLKVKRLAIGLMLAMVALSVWQLADKPWLAAGIAALGAVGVVVVARIPTRTAPAAKAS